MIPNVIQKSWDFVSQKFLESFSIQNLTNHRVVTSIIGASLDGKLSFSSSQMLWRWNRKNITTMELVSLFQKSQCKEIIIFVPGLFTDERIWYEKVTRKIHNKIFEHNRGLAYYFSKKGYFPALVLYNHGLHISENGEKLFHLILELISLLPSIKIHFISYSLGCLITRSMFYQAMNSPMGIPTNIGKVVNIASPDKGSYLEKMGSWMNTILGFIPNKSIKIIASIANLRSDAIKDLSYGIIRREDWYYSSGVTIPNYRENYFGELDTIDFYQAYGVLNSGTKNNPKWTGDGIVELNSLRYLNRVVYKKQNPESRILEIRGANHFTILKERKLYRWLRNIFPNLNVQTPLKSKNFLKKEYTQPLVHKIKQILWFSKLNRVKK